MSIKKINRKNKSNKKISRKKKKMTIKKGGKVNFIDGIVNSNNIFGVNIKNINFYVSNGRFSTEGLDKKDAVEIQKFLKKKKITAFITDYATGGSKIYFDDHKLHSEIMKNKSFNKIGGFIF